MSKRVLEMRLDEVCGPDGWYPEYKATQRGYKCRLHLRVPMADGSWEWMQKEDGAGFEEMGSVNRQTGQFDANVDGRYLYKKGILAWLDPRCPIEAVCGPQPEPIVAQPPAQAREESPDASRNARADAAAPTPAQRINLPAAGRDVYARIRNKGQRFKMNLLDGVRHGAEMRSLNPTRLSASPQEMVNEIIGEAIGCIRTMPNSRGEFPTTSGPSA